MVTNLTRLCVCVLFMFLIQSCYFTPGYYIEQVVSEKEFVEGIYLETNIWHHGNVVKSWSDAIYIDMPDTIKCYRYKQAKEFVFKLKKIDGNCNNR